MTVYLLARDGQGTATPTRHTSLPLAFPVAGGAGPFVVEVEMPIDADSYQVAVAIRDDLGGAISFLQKSAGAAFAR